MASAPHALQPSGHAGTAALLTSGGAHQRYRPQLQHLPVARAGSSILQQQAQSPRSVVNTVMSKTATPKPLSPAAAQLTLESLTVTHVQDKQVVPLLEKCLQREALRECRTWQDALQAAVRTRGECTVVACEGSPTARALSQAFPECNASKYSQPEAALSDLEGRQVQRALLPVESSLHGSVHRTYDLLLRHPNVQIVGELLAGQQHIQEDMAVAHEFGRFWMLSRDACVLPGKEMQAHGTAAAAAASFKTTVAMVLREGLSALHKVLAAFAFRDIAVSKVESRPWRAQPLRLLAGHDDDGIQFQYVLFVDFEGSLATHGAQNAVAQLQEHTTFLRVLGSYPCFHPSTSAPAAQPLLMNQKPSTLRQFLHGSPIFSKAQVC